MVINGWLVVSTFFILPFHICDVILPIDELHHFSRWLKPPTSITLGDKWIECGVHSYKCYPLTTSKFSYWGWGEKIGYAKKAQE